MSQSQEQDIYIRNHLNFNVLQLNDEIILDTKTKDSLKLTIVSISDIVEHEPRFFATLVGRRNKLFRNLDNSWDKVGNYSVYELIGYCDRAYTEGENFFPSSNHEHGKIVVGKRAWLMGIEGDKTENFLTAPIEEITINPAPFDLFSFD